MNNRTTTKNHVEPLTLKLKTNDVYVVKRKVYNTQYLVVDYMYLTYDVVTVSVTLNQIRGKYSNLVYTKITTILYPCVQHIVME